MKTSMGAIQNRFGNWSLAPATGRRIAYPTPNRHDAPLEANLSNQSPLANSHDSHSQDGTGLLLAVLISRDNSTAVNGRYTIRQTEVSIGRGEDNDLVISDPSVSNHHCRLSLAGGVWSLSDADSVNGTQVDGVVVSDDSPVAPGSMLTFGSVDLVFSPHDRWEDSLEPSSLAESVDEAATGPAATEIDPQPSTLSTADIGGAIGQGFDLDLPQSRGLPVPLIVGFVITVVAMVGYLLSRGG